MRDYINEGHVSKFSLEETKQTPSHTNYISHHQVKNVTRPREMSVVFDTGATFQPTSLNENLLKGPNLLNSLIGILIRFRKEEFALSGDIERSARSEYSTMTAMCYFFVALTHV